MDPAFAAYGYGLMGLGGANTTGSVDNTSNDNGGVAESASSQLFQGHLHHSSHQTNVHNLQQQQQDLGQSGAQQTTVGGGLPHHMSTNAHHNHGLANAQGDHGCGNNNNVRPNNSVQIPQGNKIKY